MKAMHFSDLDKQAYSIGHALRHRVVCSLGNGSAVIACPPQEWDVAMKATEGP
jgi:hypothetical protein